MKKITSILFVAIVILMAACTGKQIPKEYTLTGNFSEIADSTAVYLQTIDENSGEFVSIDTVITLNGTFVFKGVLEDSIALRFIATEGLSKPALVAIENGNIEIAFDTTLTATVKGTPINDQYQNLITKSNAIYEEMSLASNENRVEELYAKLTQETFDFTKVNINNPVGKYILMARGHTFDATQLKELLPTLNSKEKNNPKIQKLEKRLEALEATEIGKQFVDIKGTTPDGQEISLSDYAGKGKYVLIDFWASWCPPCREDMPSVVAAYNKFKNKGFEIVGVSLDHDKTAWKKGIKDLKITWPQMSDLKGWKTELGAAYAVNSIPHTVLIDKEGKIIAKNLNGTELATKLAELLK